MLFSDKAFFHCFSDQYVSVRERLPLVFYSVIVLFLYINNLLPPHRSLIPFLLKMFIKLHVPS